MNIDGNQWHPQTVTHALIKDYPLLFHVAAVGALQV